MTGSALERATVKHDSTEPWWHGAVGYEVYVRSFADSSGDGVGDLAGITSRLDHLSWLGVDALWLTPFYPSPGHDHGYDVSDYCAVSLRHGTLEDFDTLVSEAHSRGLRVMVDIVPNHTSIEHEWFARARRYPDGPDRDRYLCGPHRHPVAVHPTTGAAISEGRPGPSTRRPASTGAISSFPSSPTSTGATPPSGTTSTRSWNGGWTAASTASA